jgi:hypothetical protein
MSILLVQHASNSGSSSTLDVTLGADTTAGNCLAVSAGSAASSSRTVSGITLGGSADKFAKAEGKAESGDADVDCEIWTDQGLTEASEAIVITWSGTPSDGAAAVASEWSGAETSGAVDKVNSGGGTTTSWSSGASGTPSANDELILGAVMCFTDAIVTITGPGSPWTNFTQAGDMLAGYIIQTTAASETYSGTQNGTEFEVNAAVIVTLEAASGTPQTGSGSLTVDPSFTAQASRGQYRTASLTPEPSFTADRVHGHYRTASLTIGPVLTAARSQGHVRAAVLAVEPSFTAARTQAHVRTASLTVDPVLTAEGMQHAGAQTRTASLTVIPVFTATGMVNREAPPTVRYPYHHREAAR